jgi:hypothetical protein
MNARCNHVSEKPGIFSLRQPESFGTRSFNDCCLLPMLQLRLLTRISVKKLAIYQDKAGVNKERGLKPPLLACCSGMPPGRNSEIPVSHL